jgi:hypothetical protein
MVNIPNDHFGPIPASADPRGTVSGGERGPRGGLLTRLSSWQADGACQKHPGPLLTLSLTRSLTHLNSACCLPVPLLQGIKVGEFWKDRLDCRQWGAHFPHVAGIAGQSNVGAQSVVLSGG